MRQKFSLRNLLTLAFIALGLSTFATGTAYVQIIHNCAAPAADSVDVYLNGSKLLSSFKFRTATAYTAVPSGVTLTVGVAPAGSMSVADTLKSFSVGPLAADSNYVVIASGVVGTGFASNPDMLSTGFTLDYILNSKQTATAGNVNLDIFHGVTDAPGVDVKLTGGATLATNLQYGSSTGYLTVPATWYPISVYATGTSTAVGNYLADVSSLGGGAAVVLASGFLTPSTNNNGPSFELIAVLPNGTVITLPQQTFANVQVAHNCADPAADSVAVFIDGNLAIPSFHFRTATPFIPLLAGVYHSIEVGPVGMPVTSALAAFDSIEVTADSNYVVIASGVVGSGFAANPSGINTAFTLDIIPSARKVAATAGDVDLAIFHGATDAPAVSVVVQGAGSLVQGIKYEDATSYVEVPAASYVLNLEDSAENSTIASYVANVTGLADSAGVVYASGFLTPSANNNGPAFGLYLSLAAGGPFIPLSIYTGIHEVTNNVGLQLYPNPAADHLTAKLSLTTTTNVSMDITDLSGQIVQQVMHGSLSGEQQVDINTTQLSNGFYLLRVVDGENVSVNKFLIVK